MTEHSYNGWPALDPVSKLGLAPVDLPGHVNAFPPGVLHGDVHTVLSYVANRLVKQVEPFGPGCWGAAYRKNRNADNLSCHASGTAIDWRAPLHPNNTIGTFTPKQLAAIRSILTACGGVVRWGGDFHGIKDPMHFEILGGGAQVAAVARRLSRPAPVRAVVRVIHKLVPPRYRWTHLPLRLGDKNPDVHHLQYVLGLRGLDLDSYFGPLTLRRLEAFQRMHGLTPDGVCGKATAAKFPR